MTETTENQCSSAVQSIKDAIRYVGDASYAVLPERVAHRLAGMQKDFWGGVRCLVDKELGWIDARVAGGDRLREEWRERRDEGGIGAEG